MMRLSVISFLALLAFAESVQAACVLPVKPQNLPDGQVAETDDMNFSRRRVDRYVEDTDRYLKCLDGMEKTAIGTGRDNDERRRKRIQHYNTAMQNLSTVATTYEKSVFEFKRR
jgi:hypothetical protein